MTYCDMKPQIEEAAKKLNLYVEVHTTANEVWIDFKNIRSHYFMPGIMLRYDKFIEGLYHEILAFDPASYCEDLIISYYHDDAANLVYTNNLLDDALTYFELLCSLYNEFNVTTNGYRDIRYVKELYDKGVFQK